MAQTPIVKTLQVAGHEVRVRACPWNLYRALPDGDASREDVLSHIEDVVRECVETDCDIFAVGTRAEILRLYEIATSDDSLKPDF